VTRIYLFLILLLISFNSFNYSQNELSINVGPGYYLLNSENSNNIVGDKRFKWYLHFGFAYQRNNILGSSLIFEYSYNELIKEDAILFVITSEVSPDPIDYIGADVSLINHNFDLDYVGDISQLFAYGFGPSFVISNRIVEVDNFKFAEATLSLHDKLSSSGIGFNAFLKFAIPFSECANYFFFNSKIKFRYTHSIWFDEGIRKLDDYSQDFLTSEFEAGIGYGF